MLARARQAGTSDGSSWDPRELWAYVSPVLSLPTPPLTPSLAQIITELTVRLTPVLPLKVALTSFPTVAHAVTAVVSILAAGVSPTSLELLDGTSIRGLNLSQILPEPLDERPTVLMRFSSPLESVLLSSLDRVREIVEMNEGAELRVAKDEAENELLWKARKVCSASCSSSCDTC